MSAAFTHDPHNRHVIDEASVNSHGSAQAVQYSLRGLFSSINDFVQTFKPRIEAAQSSAAPACITAELRFSLDCLLPLHRSSIGRYAESGKSDLPLNFQTSSASDNDGITPGPCPEATASSVINIIDARDRHIVQRAASRGIVAAMQEIDCYRYFFQNAWAAKDEGGWRFAYICHDSMTNKDRHVNGNTRAIEPVKGVGQLGFKEPKYYCEGSIGVKFNMAKQTVSVLYRHCVVHPTLAGREQLGMPLMNPRNDLLAVSDSTSHNGLFAALQAESKQVDRHTSSSEHIVGPTSSTESPIAFRSQIGLASHSLKRKRDWELPHTSQPPQNPTGSLSLAELLQQSQTAYDSPTEHGPRQRSREELLQTIERALPICQRPLSHANIQQTSITPPYLSPYGPKQSAKARAPSRPHPQGHGLFTTMKLVATNRRGEMRVLKSST